MATFIVVVWSSLKVGLPLDLEEPSDELGLARRRQLLALAVCY